VHRVRSEPFSNPSALGRNCQQCALSVHPTGNRTRNLQSVRGRNVQRQQTTNQLSYMRKKELQGRKGFNKSWAQHLAGATSSMLIYCSCKWNAPQPHKTAEIINASFESCAYRTHAYNFHQALMPLWWYVGVGFIDDRHFL
jgi:hypothetical protein